MTSYKPRWLGGFVLARFATTHWSIVLTAGGASSPKADEALAKLCETYWYPVYAFLCSRGHSTDEAQDLTQAFFTRLLEKKMLRLADPERGRFRSFLLASLKNFVANEHNRKLARKRGGGVAVVSLEIETADGHFQLEPQTNETPDVVFDRICALTLLDRAMTRLGREMDRSGGRSRFEHLKPYVTGEQPQRSYAQTGLVLGMSEDAVKVAVYRLRRRFGDLVRDEIVQTVGSPDEFADEIRYLRSVIGRRSRE